MEKIDRKKVFGKYGGHCAYCGCELTPKSIQESYNGKEEK